MPPSDPHLLMAPDELECALEIAELGDGRLPHWHRGKGAAEPFDRPPDPEFERRLEGAKREAAGLPPEPDEDDLERCDDPFLA